MTPTGPLFWIFVLANLIAFFWLVIVGFRRHWGWGLAVFFGSGASQRHMPGIGLYSAAKAAEEFLALQIAAETDLVTTFVYRPGVADTRMQQQARSAQGGAANLLRPVFREYQASGALLTPAQAAQALLSANQETKITERTANTPATTPLSFFTMSFSFPGNH